MADIREMILSNDYLDFIIPVYTGYEQDYPSGQVQLFNAHLGMFHRQRQFQQIEDYFRASPLSTIDFLHPAQTIMP